MKFRKQLAILLALASLVCLAACGGGTSEVKPVADIYAEIKSAVTLPELLELGASDLKDFTGITQDTYKQSVALVPTDAVLGDMIFIFEAESTSSLETLRTKLEAFRQQKASEMNGYIASEYEKINSSAVESKGNYIWLVVSADKDAIETIIKNDIK